MNGLTWLGRKDASVGVKRDGQHLWKSESFEIATKQSKDIVNL